MSGLDDLEFFVNPASPFELEHNHKAWQALVSAGRVLAFEEVYDDGGVGVIYTTPKRAIELITNRQKQLSIDDLVEFHKKVFEMCVANNNFSRNV